MNILILTKEDSFGIAERFKKEAENMGHSVIHAGYKELHIDLWPDRLTVKKDGKDLLKGIDACVLRMAPDREWVYHKLVISQELSDKPVVNGASFIKWPVFSKILQNYILNKNDIPTVPMHILGSKSMLETTQIEYPALIKGSFGRLGKNIEKAENIKKVEEILGDKAHKFMIQKFLPTRTDYRVMVIGGKALPRSMKKTAPNGQYLTNVARGGTTEVVETKDELKNLAEKASKIFELDYCGIDIMYDEEGNPYILEINRSAGFAGFEKATKINVVGKVIEFLEEKNNG